MAIFAKIAAGSDTLTLAGAAQDSATVSARVTGHGVTNVAIDIIVGTPATGADAAPNPPNVAHGGPQDYLVLESAHSDDDDDTATYWSSGYTGVAQIQSASSSSSCLTEVARLAVSNTAENPGVMALAAVEEWIAQTISIPPALTFYSKYTDTFTRGDNADLGSDWEAGFTSQTNAQIVGNAARPVTLGTSSIEALTVAAATLTAACWATAIVKTCTEVGDIFAGVLTRMTDPATYSGFRFIAREATSNGSLITRVDAGVGTDLVSETATAWGAADEIRGISIGTRHTLQKKPSGGAFASLLTAVDAAHTTGRVGIRLYTQAAGALSDIEFESFEAGDFTSPSVPYPRLERHIRGLERGLQTGEY
jgi:hypothetical protein